MEKKSFEEDVTSSIVKFCESNCVNVTSIILFGSYANGKARKDSDVDVLIIDDTCVNGYKKQIKINGYLIQAIVFNFKEALNRLCESRDASHPFFPISYDMSVILFDKLGLGQYLKDIGTEILKVGPRKITEVEAETMRISFINYLNDGSRTKYIGESQTEALMWGAQVIYMCQDIYLGINNEWMFYNSRFKNIKFEEIDPTLRKSLHQSYEELIKNLDTRSFSKRIKELMGKHISFDEESVSPHCSVI